MMIVSSRHQINLDFVAIFLMSLVSAVWCHCDQRRLCSLEMNNLAVHKGMQRNANEYQEKPRNGKVSQAMLRNAEKCREMQRAAKEC